MKEYRPKTCEWTHSGNKCRMPTLRGKSYCEIHYPRVYQVMTDDEVDQLIEDELNNISHTDAWEILDSED